jgi:hypothetical protein
MKLSYLSQLAIAAGALACLALVAVAQPGVGQTIPGEAIPPPSQSVLQVFQPGTGGAGSPGVPNRVPLGVDPATGLTKYRYEVEVYATSDREIGELIEAERKAAQEASELAAKLRQDDDADREAAEKSLHEAIARQFEAQQKRRALEVSRIEQRLKKLQETMSKREEAKETIIARRFDELRGVLDDLGWEETVIPSGRGGGGGMFGGMPGDYGGPGGGYPSTDSSYGFGPTRGVSMGPMGPSSGGFRPTMSPAPGSVGPRSGGDRRENPPDPFGAPPAGSKAKPADGR